MWWRHGSFDVATLRGRGRKARGRRAVSLVKRGLRAASSLTSLWAQRGFRRWRGSVDPRRSSEGHGELRASRRSRLTSAVVASARDRRAGAWHRSASRGKLARRGSFLLNRRAFGAIAVVRLSLTSFLLAPVSASSCPLAGMLRSRTRVRTGWRCHQLRARVRAADLPGLQTRGA